MSSPRLVQYAIDAFGGLVLLRRRGRTRST
jgi:hypothetical protein